MDNDYLPFFVYGTLREGYGNDCLWTGLADSQAAEVEGFSLWGWPGSVPFARRDPGGIVFGELLTPRGKGPAESMLRRLDRLEQGYSRVIVDAITDGHVVRAWMYAQRSDAWTDGQIRMGSDWTKYIDQYRTEQAIQTVTG